MVASLKELTMERILREGIEYSHILPRRLSEETTLFFFNIVFAQSVENCVELTETVSDDPHADAADREELLGILKMFDIVSRDHDIPVKGRHVQATLELIGIADVVAENLEDEHFRRFTYFLEHLIQIFIDDDFVAPDHDEYHADYIVYHLRHAIH